jgi:ParB-like chromosome segregation protein Spo0J
MIKLSSLKLNPENPRVVRNENFKKLVESIRTFPKMLELRPIIVDENNIIVGGNQRYRALLDLNYKEIEDAWVKKATDFNAKELKEFLIRDNINAGEWDYEQLANEWDAIELQNWGLDVPIWNEDKEEDNTKGNGTICPSCGVEF